MNNIHAHRSSLLMVIMVICTLTIISTNYMFTKSIVTDINNSLTEKEYKKIWWKENYMILQEIQKRELLSYLSSLKNEKPELIKEIFENQKNIDSTNNNVLDINTINDLKNESYIKWNSWALITIIEFSDLECNFCIEQHKKWIYKEALDKNNDNVNYIFKNFPFPNHKNSQKEAEAGKCIENIAWWEKYLEYIDTIYSTTKWGWEWYDLQELPKLVEILGIDKIQFNDCLENWFAIKQVEKEFVQWRMLWINSVPSSMILNNKTWEYKIVSEVIDYITLESIINEITR